MRDEVFCDDGGLWVRDPQGNCRPFDIHDYEALRDEADGWKPDRAEVSRIVLDAMSRASTGHMRPSCVSTLRDAVDAILAIPTSSKE